MRTGPQEPAMFGSRTPETPWEWAKRQRTIFTSPAKDFGSGSVVALLTGGILYLLGDQSWLTSTIAALLALVVVAIGAPHAETLCRLWGRQARLVEERDREIERLRGARSEEPAKPTRPRARVAFGCDRTGWARIYVTNEGTGALFSATLQTHSITAGHVEGKLVSARWEEVDTPQQRIAHGDRRVLRIATAHMHPAPGWTFHRSDGADFSGIEPEETVDVTIAADPDLEEPQKFRVQLVYKGESSMQPFRWASGSAAKTVADAERHAPNHARSC